MPLVTFIVGTVPDIIKSIDVARELATNGLSVSIYDTLQNRSDEFERHRDVRIIRSSVVRAECRDDLDWVASCAGEIAELCGDLVVVQGDTYSALAGAHGAVRAGAALAHIEAGLRSHDPLSPFPEEMNRVFIDTQSDLLFCATRTDLDDLCATASVVDKKSFVVGNTVCDPIFQHRDHLASAATRPNGVLVSLHRRENYRHREQILKSLSRLIASFPETEFRLLKRGLLATSEAADFGVNATMIGLTEHLHFLEMLTGSQIVICDSGGILEEAVTLGVPVVCLRRTLERGRLVEGVDCIDPAAVEGPQLPLMIERLLSRQHADRGPLRETFGDGQSAKRIATLILDHLNDSIVRDEGGRTDPDRGQQGVLVPFTRSRSAENPGLAKELRTDQRSRRFTATASGADVCDS